MAKTMWKQLSNIRLIASIVLVFIISTVHEAPAAETPSIQTLPPHLQIPEKTLQGLSVSRRDFQALLNGAPLTLADLIHHVASDNQQILLKKTDWLIRQAEGDEARAIFEPELKTSLKKQGHNQRNSIEESLSRGLESTYKEHNWNYDASVEALAPSGGQVKLGYNLNRLSNSLSTSLTSKDSEYQMYFGVSLVQPLLKNAGPKVTKTGIMSANLESATAFQAYRLKLMQKVSQTAVDYWDYYQASHKLELRGESFRIAQELFEDNKERYQTGKMAETEVFEAYIGVNSRKSLLTETEHEQLKAANKLRTLLALTSSPNHLSQSNQKSAQVDTAETAPKEATTVKHVINSSDTLVFAYGESSLTNHMKRKLDQVAAPFRDKQNLQLRIVGHTDSHGLSAEKVLKYTDNKGLGQARAQKVAHYLAKSFGISNSSCKVESKGSQEPLTSNATAAGRAKNRRVEIFISYSSAQPTLKRNQSPSLNLYETSQTKKPGKQPLNLKLSSPAAFQDPISLSKMELVQAAFDLRPEYLSTKHKLEQADIKIHFAENQRWPKLDLLASYGLNGLDFSTEDSLEQLTEGKYPSWSAGLELTLPLQGDLKSSSKLKKTHLEKRQQLIRLKDIETDLSNRIDTAINNVTTSTEQLKYAQQIISIQKKLFDIELLRLNAGQSSSRIVLEKEDNYRKAQEEELISLVNQQRALIEMDLASGMILQKYNIDTLESDH